MFRHRKRGSTFVARSVSPQLLQGRRKSGDYAAPSGLGSLIESQTQGVALGCIILPLQGKDRTVCTRATNPADLWVRMRFQNPGNIRAPSGRKLNHGGAALRAKTRPRRGGATLGTSGGVGTGSISSTRVSSMVRSLPIPFDDRRRACGLAVARSIARNDLIIA